MFKMPQVVLPPVTGWRKEINFGRIHGDCYRQFSLKLDLLRSDHGSRHWNNVHVNALNILKSHPEIVCDTSIALAFTVADLFSKAHDCCRENEYRDPSHGLRASGFVAARRELWGLADFPEDIWQRLLFAIANHSGSEIKTTDDLLVGMCWDADRLDLVRFGYVLNPEQFSTQTGKEMARKLRDEEILRRMFPQTPEEIEEEDLTEPPA